MIPSGYVMQLQPFSVNDGDGIRTTIFLAGCPLRCSWCANPEGFATRNLVGWYSRQCIACGKCADICPEGIGINMNEIPAARLQCTGCGKCTEVCPSDARRQLVALRSADDIIAEVEKYSIFYRQSGGGITFSGGEATTQFEMLDYLSKKLYDKGLNLAVETCGLFDFDRLRPVFDRMDMIFMDIKHMDSEVHRQYTGVPNGKILANAARLKELSCKVVIRIPVIGGVNADTDNIRKTAEFVRDNIPDAAMELLPYHKLGNIKYEALGMESPDANFYTPGPDEMEIFRQIIADLEVELISFK